MNDTTDTYYIYPYVFFYNPCNVLVQDVTSAVLNQAFYL